MQAYLISLKYTLNKNYQLAKLIMYQNSPRSKIERSRSPQNRLSPNSKRVGFKPKPLSDLRPIQPSQKSVRSPQNKHQRSFSGLYSKFVQHKAYSQTHQIGYSAEEIKQAVNFIFLKYDSNRDGYLDRAEVKKLIERSLVHMGSSHKPSQLEIIEFIYSMDKNNDGKLSKQQLQNAFKRANRIDY